MITKTRLLVPALALLLGYSATAAESPAPKQILTRHQLRALPDQSMGKSMSVEAKRRALAYIEQVRAQKAGTVTRSRTARPVSRKVGPLLANFAVSAVSDLAEGHPVFRIRDGRIYLRLTMAETGEDPMRMLAGMGLHVHGHSGNKVFASCPVGGLYDALNLAAGVANISSIKPVYNGLVRSGAVPSEGGALLGADFARSVYGVDGSGISVCVISNGIQGAALSAQTGDLPANQDGSPKIEVCDPARVPTVNQGAEGTAMLEIVHDLAPGAELGFCPAFGPMAEQGFADSISYLARDAFGGRGCDIIVDDVAYLTEPYFEDGLVAQTVDNAVMRHGVIYFSAAGNEADNHYELPYHDVVPGDQGRFPLDTHDFGTAASGDPDIDWSGLVAGAGNFVAVYLQWNDKHGASGNDYDLYLFDENGCPAGANPSDITAPNYCEGALFPSGGNGIALQDGDDDPLEIAFVVNQDGEPPVGNFKQFFIVVDRFSGDPDKLLEMNFNGFFTVEEPEDYVVASGSVWGHAAARGAISVAATGAVVNVDGTPNPMLDVIEPFSSHGPSIIHFNKWGFEYRRPRVRPTPTITAIDGVSVTGFGNFSRIFYGTSASVSHVAAIAALVLEEAHMGPFLYRMLMKWAADDWGERRFENVWGAGLIDVNELLSIVSDVVVDEKGLDD